MAAVTAADSGVDEEAQKAEMKNEPIVFNESNAPFPPGRDYVYLAAANPSLAVACTDDRVGATALLDSGASDNSTPESTFDLLCKTRSDSGFEP